ncbi:MAG: MmcQ/YjbR family DNA-binding protein [Actinobacteria bacterium]|uniref:Unannotated protein n=1 Tax=freshwater metagenome TaxID=449393 RepID=A0A6J6S4Z0_9ZZZZ|nr:MmcQ/YjbR family DNA-binding protein [Actinomycetota bacterium]
MSDRIEPSPAVVSRLGAIAASLPASVEEDAWTGVRWRVRGRTFAHVLVAQRPYASAYLDATGLSGPATTLTFHASGDELLALTHAGPPYYKPPWSPTVVGMVLADDTDWIEVAELLVESYRLLAPARLVRLLDGT